MSKFDLSRVIGNFFKLSEDDIINAERKMGLELPSELKEFFKEVGYGFIKGSNSTAINRMIDPGTIADIRLRKGLYESDPDLDGLYDEESMLIFFEVNEGVYLALDLNDNDKSPVYYFDVKIADSLTDFFLNMAKDTEFYLDLID